MDAAIRRPPIFKKTIGLCLAALLAIAAVSPKAAADAGAGSVIAWGYNYNGQTNVPAALTGVTAISEGEGLSMALRSDGTVFAWGDNGNGTTNVPPGLSNVTAISAAGHGMALKADGTVIAWGYNSNGQTNVPPGLSGVVAIAAGTLHSMALKNDGTVIAWGDNSNGNINVPAGLSGVVAVAGTQWNSMALQSNGTVVVWGRNMNGQTDVPAELTNVIAISAGPYVCMVLKNNGTVTAWGNNNFGQLNIPAGLTNVVAMSAASQHSAALKSDGTVVVWGSNSYGETNMPPGLSGVVAMSARNLDTMVLKPYGPTIASGPVLPSGLVGAAYSQELQTADGTAPFSWRITSGQLPAGLTLSGGGTIGGTPAASGLTCFRVHATGANGLATDKDLALTINGPPTITTSSPLPSGVVGVPYNMALAASGTAPPYTWSLVDGVLPSGLSLSSAGVISGAPSAAVTASFTVQVTDSDGQSSTSSFNLTIDAQLPPTTNVVSGVTVNYSGTYMDGFYNGFNGLIVTNGGILISGAGVIGNLAGASTNFAVVTGVGSLWSNSSSLSVGGTGSFNQLTITGGGSVMDGIGIVGQASNANNNTVLVDGYGSIWSNNLSLSAGGTGSFNQLTISNSGRVTDDSGYVGYDSSSSNNTVLVTDTGSLWSNSSFLAVGYNGVGNQLTITNGGMVNNPDGYVGYASGSSNNTVLVSGAGSLWNNISTINIGNYGSANQLIIANNGTVYDAGCYIGNGSGASNNVVTVTGAGSLWTNSQILVVGGNGAFNQLTITNGGMVYSPIGYIGNNVTAGNNAALITGTGSVWNSGSTLIVGNAVGNNQLTVANGGMVNNATGYVGFTSGSGNNTTMVTGFGSLWSNSAYLVVGYVGAGNSLTITNGGMVYSVGGYIGYASGATNNAVVVTGSGSLWRDDSDLLVGSYGSSSRLTASNGGTVITPNLVVGNGAASAGNIVTVSGGNLYMTNAAQTGTLDILRGAFVFNSGTVTVNQLLVANGASSVVNFNGGTLTSGGTMLSNGTPFQVGNGITAAILNLNGGTHTFVNGLVATTALSQINFTAGLLNSGGSIISNGTQFVVGDGSSAATMNLVGGTNVFANGLTIAANASMTNAVTLATPSMTISASGQFAMNAGLAAVKVMTNAGVFSQSGGLFDAAFYDNTGTFTLLSGTNMDTVFLNEASSTVVHSGGEHDVNAATNVGVWIIAGTAVANLTNFYNQGTLTFGGGTMTTSQLVSTNASSAFNFAAGTLTTLTNSTIATVNQNFVIGSGTAAGQTGTWNIVGGVAQMKLGSGSTIIGNAAAGTGVGDVIVSGPGSVWSNSSMLYVGNSGAGNRLTLTNGGQVYDSSGFLGGNNGGNYNSAVVTGSNSIWNNGTAFTVGGGGSFNQLTLANGGKVFNMHGQGTIGNSATASNNTVLVTGTGSVWSNYYLTVGNYGLDNQLIIANGGRVYTACGGFIGESSTNNSVIITGTGSVWDCSPTGIIVGEQGSFNQLTITNGGAAWSGDGYIGHGSTANSNSVLVAGAGSSWLLWYDLYVGTGGAGNQLTISNGGVVCDPVGYIGFGGGYNTALVTGAGSLWSNSGALYIGNSSSNSLTITNGGRVLSTSGNIGGGAGNAVVVTGSGSLWSNSSSLNVGLTGSFNQLTIANGGTVAATNVVVGYTASTGTVVTVSGGLLYATNTAGNGALNVNYGTFNLNSGTVTVNRLIASNGTNSVVTFNGGTLSSGGTIISNGTRFVVGDGSSAATMNLVSGTNVFANGLTIAANASMTNIATLNTPLIMINASGQFVMNGGVAVLNAVTNAGAFSFRGGSFDLASFDNTGLFEVWNNLTVGAASGLTNHNGGDVRLVSNATVNVSGSFVITNATLEFAGASTAATPFLPGITFQNGGVIKWAGYGGNFGHHAITGNLNLDFPSGPGLMRGIVDGASLTVGGGNGLLYVGSNSLDSLTVTNGGVVFDGNGCIGLTASASYNSVLVTGAGSVWSNGTLSVGQAGSFNQLTLANGGALFSDAWSYIGNSSDANNNSVLVTGAGSVWNNGLELVVGNAGSFNQLTIANGGQVFSALGYIGNASGANSNAVLVSDAGSVWNVGNLLVGLSGSFNELTITNGGKVFNASGVIGYDSNANSNTVRVTGAGSVWNNSDSLFVGYSGSGNSLTLTNAGTVLATNIVVGVIASSTGNVVIVSGGCLYATNSAGGGALNILYGALNLNSGTVAVDRLLLTNGVNSVFTFNGGTLNSGGSAVNNGSIFQVGNGTSAATLDLLGGAHGFANDLFIDTNAMLIGTGSITGAITDAGLIAPGNSVGVITDTGDLTMLGSGGLTMELGGTNTWQYDQFDLTGALTFGGTLTVSLLNGYTPQPGDRFDLFDFGSGSGAFGQINLPALSWGGYWNTNSLCSSGVIFAVSYGDATLTNVVVINGVMSNYPGIYMVGANSGCNGLIVTNAGVLNSSEGIIGNAAGANANRAVVTGSGSLWTSSGNLIVGETGTFNQLTIASGGTVVATNVIIGDSASSGNSVTINGGNLYAFNSDSGPPFYFPGPNGGLYVGMSGSSNSLTLSNGGQVVSYQSTLGYNSGANSNSVLMSGAGTTWATSNLYVGYNGSFNQMTITNGGSVFVGPFSSSGNFILGPGGIIYIDGGEGVTALNIGYNSGANGNSLVVSGTGSVCSNQNDLSIGAGGNGNSMTVANGGQVFDGNATLGSGISNWVTVNGPGAVWNNSGAISIGNGGIGNSLTIANGGVVVSSSATIGSPGQSDGIIFIGGIFGATFASNNSALVTGAGSVWSNNGTLYVGFASTGGGNGLSIASNGTVMATSVLVGYGTGALDYVTVSGGNLIATNASDGTLNVQHGMLTLNSGAVIVNRLYLTNHASSVMNFNTGLLASGGSAVNNNSIFQVGDGTDAATFQLLGGAHSFVNGLFINTNATLTGTGAVSGSITNAGFIAPGNSIGTITDTGNVTMLSGSSTMMDLAGTNAWLYDQLDLTGAITFGGSLTVSLLNGYMPQSGDQFNLFGFGSDNGAFSQINLPSLSRGLFWNTDSLYSSGVIFARFDILASLTNVVLINGFASNYAGIYTVGINSGYNGLIVTNAGVLTSDTGVIGNSVGASTNYMLVTGAGSVWSNSGAFYAGATGSFNVLTITNAGRVMNTDGYVGYDASAGNNTVLVTGPASMWSNSGGLYIGYAGSSNSLTIANAGIVTATNVVVGSAPSTGNFITVSGGGLYVTNGALNVNDGALTLNSGTVTVNRFFATNFANSVVNFNGGTLNSGGSTVNNGSIFQIGDSTDAATLDLFGGTHSFANGLLINANATLTGTGSITGSITDAGLIAPGNSIGVITDTGNVTMQSGSTTTMDVAGTNAWLYDQLDLTGSLTFGGTLTVSLLNGYMPQAGDQFNLFGFGSAAGTFSQINLPTLTPAAHWNTSLLYTSGVIFADTNNLVVINGGTSNCPATCVIGATNGFNGLMITNAGVLTSGAGIIGDSAGANTNAVLVTGAGSVWSNSGFLYVGNSGSVNNLTIANAGQVFSRTGYIGYAGNGNAVTVTGAGSVWSNGTDLYLGNGGSGNNLSVANGGRVLNSGGWIGWGTSATSNSVIVSGAGSVWQNSGDLNVGYYGFGNSLAIDNGGRVFNSGGHIGYSSYYTGSSCGTGNTVTVTGPGSVWSNSGTLYVGDGGSYNSLVIANGGQVLNGIGYIGSASYCFPFGYSDPIGNTVTVTGPGSIWSNNSALYIGNASADNSLTIANGAQVFNSDGFIGLPSGWTIYYTTGASGTNTVIVTGPGSVWSNSGNLYVGNGSAGNSLTLTNGGTVAATNLVISPSSSPGNALTVSGGWLYATNTAASGVLNVNYGTLSLNSGTVTVNQLIVTNSVNSVVSFNGGTLNSGGTIISNGTQFVVGNGSSAATMNLVSGTNVFVDGLMIAANASMTNVATLTTPSMAINALGQFAMNGGVAVLNVVTNAGTFSFQGGSFNLASFDNTGLFEVWNTLTVGAASGLTNRNGGDVRLVSNATVNVSGSFVVTNATLEFAGASTAATPFLPGIIFQNGSAIKWAGYGGSFGNHAITGNLNLDLPSGPGLMRGIVDNASLAVGGGSGLLYVGSNNLDSLTITNGGQVFDGTGYIGFNASASNNSALVGGSGSLWSNSGLFVGYSGSGSSLTIANGGIVFATNIVVGVTASSTGNVVTVSGGSLYATNSSGGGALNVLYGTLNLNSGTVAVDRLLLTNFANSVFNFNGGVLQAGQMLSAQPITVNGGTLSLAGSFVNSPGATFQLNSGSVIVPGSMANQGSFVQNGGLFDPLVFTNSGSFVLNSGTNMDGLFLNLASGSVQQTGGEHDVNVATNYGSWTISGGVANLTNLVIDGGGVFTNAGAILVSTNASGTGGMDVRNGMLALLSGTVMVNQFYATNGVNSVVSFNGGTLNSGGTVVSNGSAFIVGDTGSGAALNLVGGSHSFSSDLIIGNSGSSNSILITNGGSVLVTGCGILGNTATSSGNSALVTGAGSVWSNSVGLFVGILGSFNQLTVAKGGQVFNGQGVGGGIGWGDMGESANSNTVIITDSGSLWSSSDQLYVGYLGSGNALTIANGGRVSCNGGLIGYLGLGNNAVLVTGAGSVWSNTATLNLGFAISDNNNTLTISNGAAVFNSRCDIGYNGNSNAVLVTGPGSVWNNGGSSWLVVGEEGSSNTLTITSGGTVFSGNAAIGGANNNAVLVAGAGSVWSNSGEIDIGYNSSGNSLFIANGGTVTATNVSTGGSPSAGNVLSVSGGWLYATNTTASGALNVNFGALNLNSGTVTVNRFYANNGGNSIVNFNGGTFNSGGSAVNNGSIFQVGDGSSTATFDLFGGAHSFANGLFINTNAILTGTGSITGSITDAGLIAPGNGFGVISDTGNLTLLGGGAMTMELGGTNTWLYDQFDLTGTLGFGGTLTVALLNGYTPQAGDRFNLFGFGSDSGVFSATNLPTLSPTLYWNTSALYSTGVIEVDQTATGAVQVILAPHAAIDSGALWQVDADGNWHTNNETVGGLVVGSHTLSYTNLTGWIAPTNQTVQVSFGATTTNTGTYQLTPTLLAAVSRKAQGGAGTFDLNVNLNGTPSATVEPRVSGPTQLLFTFNKAMAAADGTLDATEFTLTNATFVSASIVSSNLTLNLTNVVDQSRVTVVMNGLTDLTGNPLSGTNAVIVRALYGDDNQSGSVNAVDLQQVKNNLLAALTPANFLCDVNCSGTVNAVDLQQIKNNLLHSASFADSGATRALSSGDASSSLTTSALSTTTLGEALSATNLTWSADGDAPWTATVAEDGSQAAWSGSIGNLNVSWVETMVAGPGTLSFDWMVSSEPNGDCLTFAIDGVNQPGAISGEVGWQTLTFNIPAGTHRLTWTYSKNAATAAGLDAGWLRRVVYR